MTAMLMTYTLQDRGYDCDQHGKWWDCTAEDVMAAIRMLDGFADAAYAEPISDTPGCSTFAVYRRAPLASGADWSKIGVVCLHGKRPA